MRLTVNSFIYSRYSTIFAQSTNLLTVIWKNYSWAYSTHDKLIFQTVEKNIYKNLCSRKIFAETLIFLGNLECQLAGMTHHQNGDLKIDRSNRKLKLFLCLLHHNLLQLNSRPPTSPSTGSSCCKVARTKTAVLPIPDLAWQTMSIPRIAWGMHSCWTKKRTSHDDFCEKHSISATKIYSNA